MNLARKKILKAAMGVVCFFAVIAAAYVWYMEELGNFHPITPGEAYRSGQLDADELEHYIATFGIRSVINLRGPHPDEPWYVEEVQTCRILGVRHLDLRLSAQKAPSPEEMRVLLGFFATAPRPVLIHCEGGADRSGVAAAIWLAAVDGKSKSEAEKQLSIRYGHMPAGSTQVLDRFFEKWATGNNAESNTQAVLKARPALPGRRDG